MESQFSREGYAGSVVMRCPICGQYNLVGKDDRSSGRTSVQRDFEKPKDQTNRKLMNFNVHKCAGVEQPCASVQAGNLFGAALEQAIWRDHSVSSIGALKLGHVKLWLTSSGAGVSPLCAEVVLSCQYSLINAAVA